MKAQVEICSDETDLSREAWRFWYGPRGMVLDAWRNETRPTKRHKWRSSHYEKTAWTRLNSRNNRMEKPEPPEAVISAALKAFADSMTYRVGDA